MDQHAENIEGLSDPTLFAIIQTYAHSGAGKGAQRQHAAWFKVIAIQRKVKTLSIMMELDTTPQADVEKTTKSTRVS